MLNMTSGCETILFEKKLPRKFLLNLLVWNSFSIMFIVFTLSSSSFSTEEYVSRMNATMILIAILTLT